MFINTIEYALDKLLESLDETNVNDKVIIESVKRTKLITSSIKVCANTKIIGTTIEDMEKSLNLKSTLILMNDNEYNDYCTMMNVFNDIKKSLVNNGIISEI